jgi:hypothetical protein
MWHAWERRGKCTRFWWESPKERDHLEDQGVGGKMGSERILGRLAWGSVDWIRLAQDRDRWRAVVSAVMNLRVLAPRGFRRPSQVTGVVQTVRLSLISSPIK